MARRWHWSALPNAKRANLQLQYDVYHMQIMEGDLMRSIERLLPAIGHIQIADNPGRHEPGTGEINFTRLLERIDALGYAGFVGCEYLPESGTLAGLGWARKWMAVTRDEGAGMMVLALCAMTGAARARDPPRQSLQAVPATWKSWSRRRIARSTASGRPTATSAIRTSRIPLPGKLEKLRKVLQALGASKEVDALVVAMNRAAETALPECRAHDHRFDPGHAHPR